MIVHSSNAHNGWGEARLTPETGNSTEVSHVHGRDLLEPLPAASQVAFLQEAGTGKRVRT